MRSTFKVLFYVNASKEKNGIVPIMGRVTINGSVAQFSCKRTIPKELWDVKGNRAKGKSKEAREINLALDNIKAQIIKHYQRLSDREAYVTAEMVRNAYQDIGTEYETLLGAFDKDNATFKKRVGTDRVMATYMSRVRHMSDLQTYAEAVRIIKEAILRSQYRAASSANKEQLSLYYGIGCYVSKNSREDFWGKGAIETISQQLQKELPGLRGFSATNIKNMRSFYEEWSPIVNRQPVADENKTLTAVSDSVLDEQMLLMEIRQPMADEFNWSDFVAIGFSHHIEIITKAKSLDARLFYIHESATRFWNKYTLRDYLKADLYN